MPIFRLACGGATGGSALSILGITKLHGLNPQEWLSGVLFSVPTRPNERARKLSSHHFPALRETTDAAG